MRVFSEAEIAQILQRAAERQAQATQTPPHAGLTLAELEVLSADAGLDVAHVRAAAAEIAPASPAARSRSATHVFVERKLDGPLDDAAWDEVVAELRNRFGKAGMAAYTPGAAPAGEVTAVGKHREWAHTDGLGVETRVLLTSRGDGARLRLSQRVGMMSEVGDSLLVAAALSVLPALGLLSSFEPTALAAALAALVALVLFAGVYLWDKTWRLKKQEGLVEVSDALVGLLVAHGAPTATATATPALSLDALGDAPDAASTDEETSSRTRSASRT